ncbi:MAG: hypothetical protein AAF492_13375, partial [Verrucomicrobiota bacterium]
MLKWITVLILLTATTSRGEGETPFISLEGPADFVLDEAGRDPDPHLWGSLMVPGSWQSQGLSNFEWWGWYQFNFRLGPIPESQMGVQFGQLGFGAHEVYLNGRQIGGEGMVGRGGFQAPSMGRVYELPKADLRPNGALNVLRLRIYRESDLAGILDGPVRMGPLDVLQRDHWQRSRPVYWAETASVGFCALMLLFSGWLAVR